MPRFLQVENVNLPPRGGAATGPLASGILLGLCVGRFDLTGLAWLALVPLGLSWRTDRVDRWYYLAAYAGGVIFHLEGMSWLRTCFGATGFASPYSLGWLIAGHLGGLSFLLAVWWGRRIVQAARLPLAIWMPTIWTAYELFRAHVALLITETGFPWLKLGLTQADHPQVAQIADLGGEYGLTFFVALASGAVADGLHFAWHWSRPARSTRAGRPSVGGMLGSVLVVGAIGVAVFGYGHWRLATTKTIAGPVICLVGENDLPPLVHRLSDLVAQGASESTSGEGKPKSLAPDLLVWSERAYHLVVALTPRTPDESRAADSRPAPLTSRGQILGRPAFPVSPISPAPPAAEPTGLSLLVESARSLGVSLAMGCQRVDADRGDGSVYNSLAVVDSSGKFLGAYDKQSLTPWYEFVPFGQYLGGRPWGEQGYVAGDGPRIFEVAGRDDRPAFRFGAAICYDVAFSNVFRSTMRQASESGAGVDFFVQVGAEGQDPSGRLSRDLERMARLRAIETRRSLVRNAADGASGIWDSCGRSVVRSTQEAITRPTLLGAMPLDVRSSLYVVWGDWPIVLVAVVVLLAGLRRRAPLPVVTGRRDRSPRFPIA